MNKKQLIVMWAGIAIIVLMGIFPPVAMNGQGICTFIGFQFIFNKETIFSFDLTRLGIQLIIVSAITTGLIITFKDKNKND